MSTSNNHAEALRAPQSIKEQSLPKHITPIKRPQALGYATELVFLRWERRSLDTAAQFLVDFGFQDIQQAAGRLTARGTGASPAIFVAQQGAQNRFLGSAFVMSVDTDLQVYVKQMGAMPLEASQIPGGGRGVQLADPGGHTVWLLQGQAQHPALPNRESVTALINSPTSKPRVNRALRTPIEPARIVRIGHFVMQAVDFQATSQWYMRVLGLIPTDVQYLSDGSPTLAFCRLNLGDQPADHHTMVFSGGIEDKYEHSAYEVIDLDAIGQGQQVMRSRGYKHLWGIGRHFFGSQFFDYWYDPDGFEFEHYADGDLFTSDIETEYAPLEFGSVWAWGADVPKALKPPKNLRSLLTVIKRLRSGQLTVGRLKLFGEVMSDPGRPWLK
jgi:predicted enzyme related to lactoylglutathione lyase